MPTLTERQQQVLDCFKQGMGARAIADELGISRNAVYQVKNRLQELGALDPDFNPTGQPSRLMNRPGAEFLARITSNGATDADSLAQAGALALAQELRNVRDELVDISHRISRIVPR